MMFTQAEYKPEVYKTLPTLRAAHEKFRDAKAEAGLAMIAKLFVEHDVCDDLSIMLLHRHFDMNQTEKLVEFGAVSSPWNYRNIGGKLLGGTVKPRSWMFRDDEMMPYEFGYNEALGAPAYPDLPDKAEFYQKFGEILKSEGLTDVLGLTSLGHRPTGTVGMEKTFGRSNIMFNVPLDSFEDENATREFIPAMWQISPSGEDHPGSFLVSAQQ